MREIGRRYEEDGKGGEKGSRSLSSVCMQKHARQGHASGDYHHHHFITDPLIWFSALLYRHQQLSTAMANSPKRTKSNHSCIFRASFTSSWFIWRYTHVPWLAGCISFHPFPRDRRSLPPKRAREREKREPYQIETAFTWARRLVSLALTWSFISNSPRHKLTPPVDSIWFDEPGSTRLRTFA